MFINIASILCIETVSTRYVTSRYVAVSLYNRTASNEVVAVVRDFSTLIIKLVQKCVRKEKYFEFFNFVAGNFLDKLSTNSLFLFIFVSILYIDYGCGIDTVFLYSEITGFIQEYTMYPGAV